MKSEVYRRFVGDRERGRRAFAVLVDPHELDSSRCIELAQAAMRSGGVHYFFVGGSLVGTKSVAEVVATLKAHCSFPVVLFPGSNLHIDAPADALLFLSLISGRNPDLLIGQHVVAAPLLKRMGIEVLPTGYVLVDGGKPTTVSYMSNTTPLPADKPALAACTAMAGEMLGLKLLYLEAGSGAPQPVSPQMIGAVRKSIAIPLIVGGGITSGARARSALAAGADVIVVGNGIEKDIGLLDEIAKVVGEFNGKRAD